MYILVITIDHYYWKYDHKCVIYKSTCPENYIPAVMLSLNPTSSPPMAEILLFNSVFHDGVAPVSVSTLKPLLGAIGVLPLKP